jgi:hypothetical protein
MVFTLDAFDINNVYFYNRPNSSDSMLLYSDELVCTNGIALVLFPRDFATEELSATLGKRIHEMEKDLLSLWCSIQLIDRAPCFSLQNAVTMSMKHSNNSKLILEIVAIVQNSMKGTVQLKYTISSG